MLGNALRRTGPTAVSCKECCIAKHFSVRLPVSVVYPSSHGETFGLGTDMATRLFSLGGLLPSVGLASQDIESEPERKLAPPGSIAGEETAQGGDPAGAVATGECGMTAPAAQTKPDAPLDAFFGPELPPALRLEVEAVKATKEDPAAQAVSAFRAPAEIQGLLRDAAGSDRAGPVVPAEAPRKPVPQAEPVSPEAAGTAEPASAEVPEELRDITANSAGGFEEVITGGFGDPQNVYTWSLKSFEGYLYASTAHLAATQSDLDGSAELWRFDGETWEQITDDGFGNPNNTGIRNLVEWRGKLYAAVVNERDGAEIWRSDDGVAWEQVAEGGLGDPGNEAVRALFVFENRIYAGLQDTAGGTGELYRSFNGKNWFPIAEQGFGFPRNDSIHDLGEFDGFLYASVRNTNTGAQIWRSPDGIEWDQVVGPFGSEPAGFGFKYNVLGFHFKEFKDYFYVSTANAVTGFGVYRTQDGLTFERVGEFGFGDPDNVYGWRFHVHDDALWFGTNNFDVPDKGGSVWRSFDGVNWEEMVGGNGIYDTYGFGNQFNWGIRSFETYEGDLYIGTANCPFGDCVDFVNGAEIHRWTGEPTPAAVDPAMAEPATVGPVPADSLDLDPLGL